MTRTTMAAMVIATVLVAVPGHARLRAADHSSLAGRWTLNRQLSQFPTDLGFGMDLLAGAISDSGGGRGQSGGGTGLGGASFQESEEDARRREMLVEEARNPPSHLTIAQTETSVTITAEHGRSRTFHPNGKEEVQTVDQVPLVTTSRWDGGGLEVRYKVEPNRELHYTYSRSLDPPRLVVQTRFVERGGHDVVTRVYEPTRANEPAVPQPGASPARAGTTAPPSAPVGAPRPPAAVPPAGAASSAGAKPPASAPGATPPVSSSDATAPAVAKGPDADLKGITDIGLVVEDLSSQAAACGLSQAPIEAAVSKSLTDAGFKVRRNADEDTYVYVHIVTTSAPGGLCVSRYDAFLYTYTTARLPYQATSVLAQVMLLHEGGIAGGAAAAHAETVMRSVKQYADTFAQRIRDANQQPGK